MLRLLKVALLFLSGFLLFYIITPPTSEEKNKREIPLLTTGKPELCLLCHEEVIQEKAHAVEMVGCSGCHLGNPLSSSKAQAHRGLIKNPSDLRVIEKTCGQPNCHPSDVKKIRNALMATNHGIMIRLLQVFGEEKLLQSYPHLRVANLYQGKAPLNQSEALDYFRKLCGSCHLYLEKKKLPDFLATKGGGCSACHLTGNKEDLKVKKLHPRLEKKVHLEKCVLCHNRSGRIGLTYQGLYETPQGGIYDQKWMDGRELIKINPDVHFRAGLHCTDCHTREEVMGDGNFYKNIAEALEVTCETCHEGKAKTTKGRSVAQIKLIGSRIFQETKFTGKTLEVKRPVRDCQDPNHRRLSCSACHSHYMPQCMGCHVRMDPKDKHLDKIKARETKGLWEEYESYREILKPVLAIREDKVVPVTPG